MSGCKCSKTSFFPLTAIESAKLNKLSAAEPRTISIMFKRLSSALQNLVTGAPTTRDRRVFDRACLRYLKGQGWRLTGGRIGEFYGEYGRRRILVFFFFHERDLTELHIGDWNEDRIRVARPTFVFSQVQPHEAFIRLAAERQITLRYYMDISILDLTIQDHAEERAMINASDPKQ